MRAVNFVYLIMLLTTSLAICSVPDGYNTPIPSSITTPDEVQSPLGTLKFFDGYPSNDTVVKIYDHLDYIRGVEAFLNGIPAASLEAMRKGNEQLGVKSYNQVLIFDQLLDSNPLFLTGNTDTVYGSAFIDLEKEGPMVIEIPKNIGPTTINDAWFRYVIDMGPTGPDKGEGGKYLILPPDYTETVPEGYFVAKSPTYRNWIILRGFLVDGKPDFSANNFKKGLKIYPLSKQENPPKMEFISGSQKPFNTIHSNNSEFYKELNEVIQKEPVEMIDPELRGIFSSIGIEKGKPFEPDKRMSEILSNSAAVANATARTLAFNTRDPEAYIYNNSFWKTGFIGGDYEWLIEQGIGGRNLDARTYFFYIATVNTPAMAKEIVGKGSQYALSNQDENGKYLDGSKTYKLNIPSNIPAKDFVSVVVYDPQTRSELQTDQPFPSKNSKRDQLQKNKDGSIDIYFGPTSPEGKESNWIQTVPGKGWFTILRLYGPEKPWFDKTWRPGEIKEVKN